MHQNDALSTGNHPQIGANRLRLKLDLNISEFATLLMVSRNTATRWCNGEIDMPKAYEAWLNGLYDAYKELKRAKGG